MCNNDVDKFSVTERLHSNERSVLVTKHEENNHSYHRIVFRMNQIKLIVVQNVTFFSSWNGGGVWIVVFASHVSGFCALLFRWLASNVLPFIPPRNVAMLRPPTKP